MSCSGLNAGPAPGGHPHILAGGALPGQVRLGEHGQPDGLPHEAVAEQPGADARHAGLRRDVEIAQAGAEPLAAEHLGEPLGRPVPLGDQHHPPPAGQPLAHVRDGARRIPPVAGQRRGFDTERNAPRRCLRLPGVALERPRAVERGARPPADAQFPGGGPHVGQRLERGRTQVNRRLAAVGRAHPGGLEEFLAGGDQVGGAGPDPLGVTGQHQAARRHVVQEQLHRVRQHRRERLHAVHRDALGQLAEDVGQPGVLRGEARGPLPDGRGEQQLAARRRPQAVRRDVQAALVGDPEVPDLLHRVAPELHPERVLFGGREHVQDAAADRDLAAALHQVGTGVADVHQVRDDLLEVGRLAGLQRDRGQVAEPADHRLEQAADRGDQHGDRAGLRPVRIGVGQPPQHGQPPSGGVRAR